MKKRFRIPRSIVLAAAISGALALAGCADDKTDGEKEAVTADSTAESTTDKAVEKETETQTEKSTEPNPADGDTVYTFPADFKSKKSDVVYGKVETVKYNSTTVGKERSVTVVLPPNYTTDRKYPVLYLCHGLGQDNMQWIVEGRADIIIGNMIAAGEAEEMILVMPNCRARENDAGNPPDAFSINNYLAFDNFKNDFEKDLKPFIESSYSVAKGRENTAIAGFSMGGRVSLHLGMSMQDTFGYVAAFCPAPGIFKYTMNGVTENGLFTEEEFKVKDEYAGKTKMMIVAGKSDRVVFAHPETYHAALEKNKTEHTWYKLTGGHDFNVSDKGLYNFAKEIFKAR